VCCPAGQRVRSVLLTATHRHDSPPTSSCHLLAQALLETNCNIQRLALPWLPCPCLQAITQRGYDVILSAPWYLNLGCYATQDWQDYYAADPHDFKGTVEQVGCERAAGWWVRVGAEGASGCAGQASQRLGGTLCAQPPAAAAAVAA